MVKKKSISSLKKGMITSREILKNGKATLNLKEYEIPSVLGDQNRFFKDEFPDETQQRFFRRGDV
jgi:hypothetical protein